MGMVAAGAMAAGSIMEGVSSFTQSRVEADAIDYRTEQENEVSDSMISKANAAQVAQGGISGLTQGSFENIYVQNEVNRAKTYANIKYSGDMEAQAVRNAGTSALIQGVVSAGAGMAGGVGKANYQKKMLSRGKARVTGSGTAGSGKNLWTPKTDH